MNWYERLCAPKLHVGGNAGVRNIPAFAGGVELMTKKIPNGDLDFMAIEISYRGLPFKEIKNVETARPDLIEEKYLGWLQNVVCTTYCVLGRERRCVSMGDNHILATNNIPTEYLKRGVDKFLMDKKTPCSRDGVIWKKG